MESLFVYGTLMPNAPHGEVLEKIGGKFVPATIKGKLIGAGWSASMGYPGIKLSPKEDVIHGYLFYSHNLCDHWEYLDDFEGEEFERHSVTVERYDETNVETFIYVLKEEITALEE